MNAGDRDLVDELQLLADHACGRRVGQPLCPFTYPTIWHLQTN